MATKRRVNSRADYYRTKAYVDGNTVRKAVEMPDVEVQERLKHRHANREIAKNRKKALQMGKGYVFFLTIVSIATLFMCVQYIQLRSSVTSQIKTLANLESELNQLTAENDALYNQTVNNVDLEHIKDVAINELGMDYATEDQIVWYSNNTSSSYVRQYMDVPTE